MAEKPGYKLRLEPEDDYLHPLEEAENFNESMYFNVFDRNQKIGGWSASTIGRTKAKAR